jgi:hypothetical protein
MLGKAAMMAVLLAPTASIAKHDGHRTDANPVRWLTFSASSAGHREDEKRPRRPPGISQWGPGRPVAEEAKDPLRCGAVRKAGRRMRQTDFLAQQNVGFGVKDWLTRRDQFASMSIGQESHVKNHIIVWDVRHVCDFLVIVRFGECAI